MKIPFASTLTTLFACGSLLCLAAPGASAAAPDKYQVTGSVTALTDTTITVLKGKESFEMNRDASLKVTGGELKIGAKVTVQYKITAVTAEVKADKTDTKAKTPKTQTTAPGTTTGSAPQQPGAPAAAPSQPAAR
ncbi:MAG: hypothetical protein JO117_05610 [Verrucomicrobia bacterium]|nr:hypothetical protein [Verrucomicrobiota bacterium]MBV9658361.1 hypothetical protein [Verrucomicrobiota bacterium]